MTITPEAIQEIHSLYCSLSNQSGLPLRFDRQRWWNEWLQCGFSKEDLKLVVRYLRQGIHSGKRNQGCLKFSNLICQVDRFEEELFEARRVLNPRPNQPRYITGTQVVGDIQRQVEVPRSSDPIDIAKIFAKFREK